MMSVQARFIGLSGFHQPRKDRTGKASLARGNDHRNLLCIKHILKHSKLILHEQQSFRGLPVNYDSNRSPLDRDVLAELHRRHTLSVRQFGTTAEMVRLDWVAGTSQESISDLFTKLQDKAGRQQSKIHYLVCAEHRAGQPANHYHGVIWYDSSKMTFPYEVNKFWKKLMLRHELADHCRIQWRRDNDLPFRFKIGQTDAAFKAAFFLAAIWPRPHNRQLAILTIRVGLQAGFATWKP